MPTKKLKIHFIGIGGIGVSALAKYYLEKGHTVSGSDLISSEITEALKKFGAKIFIGEHKAINLKCSSPSDEQPDLVIYSPAIPVDNPELKRAKKLGIKCQSYPEALGELIKKYFTIAVCGSHGKSTVAAMIGLLLIKASLNPTVLLGTKLREFDDSNFRMGGFPKSKILNLKSKILIIEADEHFASFLNYWPKIIVLTTMEADHLDYYKNFKNYVLAFKKFISHLPKDGWLIANKDDKNVIKIAKKNKKVLFYSLRRKETEKIKRILKIPGEFNASNALAALTVARILKIPDKTSFKALSEYKGSWRRFETKQLTINNKQLTIINDYGHHPTQIKVTLEAAREKFPKNKIWCIFQPHQYQRTYYLFDDFVKVFSKAPIDKLIITDIYDVAGREAQEIKKKLSSEKLVNKIKNQKSKIKNSIMYIPSIQEVAEYLKKNLRGSRLKRGEPRSKGAGEVVIIMGAGDIYRLSKKLEEVAKRVKMC